MAIGGIDSSVLLGLYQSQLLSNPSSITATNQRIAQAAVRRANALVARLEAGLSGDAFADGSITARNLAPGVVRP